MPAPHDVQRHTGDVDFLERYPFVRRHGLSYQPIGRISGLFSFEWKKVSCSRVLELMKP